MEESIARLKFEAFPERSLTVLLLKNVTNSEELRGMVVTGQLHPECSLINASMVPDIFVLHMAAHKALLDQARGSLKTRSIHAELVFNLSGSKHIGQSLDRFGINGSCQHVLVGRLDATPEELAQIQALVKGTLTPLTELGSLTNEQELLKFLKASKEELQVGSLTDALLMRIGARDC